ncbi:hypothetical protein Rctr197k_191 [Virus Rctr197k]|nr:hypothetical protein Rctr197k_191 [Virus Rctr197k]
MTTGAKRALLIVGIGLAVTAMMTAYVLLHRKETTWLQAPCGDVQWARTRLPAAIYLTSELPEDWIEPIKQGLAVVDPWGKLGQFKGRLDLSASPPAYAVTISQWNDDQHGNTRWEAGADCKIIRMFVSMPVLMLPGKTRVRAAAHELGHAWGLDHSDWETDIMYPKASSLFPFSLSDRDRALLEEAYLR